ncbi:MAG: hypothetical protein HY820_29905 [Acidobacteria bacterium]|nr:hypothetical protein [Acidobacteriota bacterium]
MLIPRPPITHEVDESTVDAVVAACHNQPAVFLIWPREGEPYLSKTTVLRRRLLRLLGPRTGLSRMLHLRSLALRIEYWPYASRLEASLIQYALAREHFPETYLRILKLRNPTYVKLVLSNPFPRTMLTTRLSGSESVHYGPFRTRAAAEQFEAAFLDFFQLRRCQEDLIPSPDHPGCVYGEMNKCLRPCQLVVTEQEYASEAMRIAAFLRSDGESLIESIRGARDRLSADMEFEEAARMHKRLERAETAAALRGELATDIQRLSGIAVLPSVQPDCVALWFFSGGAWRAGVDLSLAMVEGRPVPLDRRIKDTVAALPAQKRVALKDRQEHMALLTAWVFSSWRDGEWVACESLEAIPYRKLVNAVHRVAKATGAVMLLPESS